MTPADLRALADRRFVAAVREGREQLANGWTLEEVIGVLTDAAGPIADLRRQADEAEAADAYWDMMIRARRDRLRRFGSLRRGVL